MGFVFGAMGFVQKILGGCGIMFFQALMPDPVTEENGKYFKFVVGYGCGGIALFGILSILAIYPFNLGQR